MRSWMPFSFCAHPRLRTRMRRSPSSSPTSCTSTMASPVSGSARLVCQGPCCTCSGKRSDAPRRFGQNIADRGLPNEVEGVLRDHPAIHAQSAIRQTEPRSQSLQHPRYGFVISHIAGQNFVPPRISFSIHHCPDGDLFAVGPVISGVTSHGFRVTLHLSLEVSARQIV